MIARKSGRIIALVAVLLSCPQISMARDLTNREFLGWSEPQQRWWLSAAMLMAGHVAHRRDEVQGGCIWDWYFTEQDARFRAVRESLRQYPDHAPTAILVGWIEKHCGRLDQ